MPAKKKLLTLFFILTIQLIGYAQSAQSKKSFSWRVCFAGIQSGVISKYDHLEDSLSFTDSLANQTLQIVSFKLALACNGNVVKYLENKSGNKLTAEMKEAIREMHPGCTMSFQGIKVLFVKEDLHGKDSGIDNLLLKLTLKD